MSSQPKVSFDVRGIDQRRSGSALLKQVAYSLYHLLEDLPYKVEAKDVLLSIPVEMVYESHAGAVQGEEVTVEIKGLQDAMPYFTTTLATGQSQDSRSLIADRVCSLILGKLPEVKHVTCMIVLPVNNYYLTKERGKDS